MSEEPTSPKGPAINLTPREQEIAIAVLLNQAEGIKIDYAGMASALGLKSNASAVSSWAALRKKLYPDGQAGGPNLKSATKAKASPKPKASDTNGVKKPRSPRKPTAAKATAKATTTATDDTAIEDCTTERTPEPTGTDNDTPDTPVTPTAPSTTATKKRSPKKPAAGKAKGKGKGKATAAAATSTDEDAAAASPAPAAGVDADAEMGDAGTEGNEES